MDVIYDSIFRLGSKGLSAQNRFKREHECLYVRLGFQVLSGAKVFFSFFFFPNLKLPVTPLQGAISEPWLCSLSLST